jgi:glycosyltransferase involved in cell wall biosynthesis
VIVISNWTKQQVISRYQVAPKKIDVLYNWVRPSCQLPVPAGATAEMRLRYNLPTRYIAYLGGYRAYKNVEFLIAAWDRARQKQPTPPLVLAGVIPDHSQNGFMCDVTGAIAKTGAGPQEILLPGMIADEDLPAFYAGAALFVSPSRQEGFGYPAVEAMACGAPVLVSDASVYPEIIPEEHLRFGLADPAVLAVRIRAALDHPEKYTRTVDCRFTEAYGKTEYERIVRERSSDP